MTPYDGAMIGVVVAGMIWGAFKGVTWQIASLASLILGYIASHTLSAQVAGYFPGEPIVQRTLAMIAIYVGVSGGIFFLAWLIRATLKRWKFEAYDRHLGMLMGGAEGGFIGMVLTLFVVSLAPQSRTPIFASTSGKVVRTVMASLGPVLPAEARDELQPFLNPSAIDTSKTANAPASMTPIFSDPSAPGSRDAATKPASLGDFLENTEKQVGKAIADKATEQLQQATGSGNGGTTNRR